MAPSALVVTVVHHPDDARIRHREIEALLEAGWQVMYAAPFAAYGITRPVGLPHLLPVDLPRAQGTDRLGALRAARALLRQRGPAYDVVLLHDPELVVAAAGLRLPPVVWDVHEDTAAALTVRGWLPGVLRRPAQLAVRGVERWAERRMPLLLAEEGYAARFRRPHPVVPNTTRVPPRPPMAARPDRDGVLRVVYLGNVSPERGLAEMVEVGRALVERSGHGGVPPVRLEVIGPAQGGTEPALTAAHQEGALRWHGFLPSDQALQRLDGALAGLSLLRDVPNYRHSMPTKVVEYLAHGVPAISTPLPVPAELVERSGGGVLVPFGPGTDCVEAVVDTVLSLAADPERARAMGAAGHAVAAADYDWDVVAPAFVAALETVVADRR